MFIEAIDEDYVVELKEGLREYDGRTLLELLNHVKKYAKWTTRCAVPHCS